MASVLQDHQAQDPAIEDVAARLRVAVNRLYRRLQRESLAGLSPAQASALGAVKRLGQPTLGELALAEQVQPPTMTRLVSSMTAAGLLTRHPDPDDRRVVRVRLSPEGRRVLGRIASRKEAALTRALAALEPGELAEAAQLVDLLERLVAQP